MDGDQLCGWIMHAYAECAAGRAFGLWLIKLWESRHLPLLSITLSRQFDISSSIYHLALLIKGPHKLLQQCAVHRCRTQNCLRFMLPVPDDSHLVNWIM